MSSSSSVPPSSPQHDASVFEESPGFDDGQNHEEKGLLTEDIESQRVPASTPSAFNHEDTESLRKKFGALAGYFLCNIGLTIYNKAILGSFRFPWLLTALHSGCSAIGCIIMLNLGVFRATRLTSRERVILLLFSVLFTINIAISNVSLAMVSVPFHQIVRATTPFFTTLLFRGLYGRTFSRETYLSLVPVILGALLATYGDVSFTDIGFILTFFGVLLAAFKTILTNRIMTGTLSLSFWEVLLWMSPLAFVQSMLYALVTGELSNFLVFVRGDILAAEAKISPLNFAVILAGNGILAFALNVSSFSTNKVVGALTMTVCANIKQCLTVVLGVLLFDVRLSIVNGWGILITLAGGAVYSYVELDNKRRKNGTAKVERYDDAKAATN